MGLAFENFDAIGRWRLRERIEAGTGENPLVDASGTLPDGKVFDGPEQFKKLLAGNDKKLAEAFIENLSAYALRRLMTVDDKPYIKKILETSQILVESENQLNEIEFIYICLLSLHLLLNFLQFDLKHILLCLVLLLMKVYLS